MNALFTVLTVLVLIASVLITLIVLLQNGKGDEYACDKYKHCQYSKKCVHIVLQLI